MPHPSVSETATPTSRAALPEILSLRFVVLLSGAVLMALEILGSRVLAPSYGSSVYVWGSLISTFLVALSVGYALGGRLADRHPSSGALSAALAMATVLMLPAVMWSEPVLCGIEKLGWDTRWSALLAAVVLFLPPSLAMGMVTPFAVRLGIRRTESAGSVAGGYSALSTAGSIAGTLLATFVLIPLFPVQTLLLGLAAALALCAIVLVRDRASAFIAGLALAAAGVAAAARAPSASIGGDKILFQRDTAYHHIRVTQLGSTNWLRFDNLTQGAVNLEWPHRSILRYDEALMLSFALRPAIRRVCVIGLGGGSFPRAVARLDPEAEIETVEIDPVVRDVAQRYFLYKETDRVRTVIEDGRVFLARPGAPYDLIVLDAFNSTGTPFHLTTREFFEVVRRRLGPDGVFAANFVGSLMGREARLFWAAYRTIRRQFGQVYIVSPELKRGVRSPQGNLIVLATVSGDPVPPETLRRNAARLAAAWQSPLLSGDVDATLHSPEPPIDVPELTDAYAPVEALQHF
jgi:spermidine synthase